ncbi:MAG: acetyl-CoA carboxylase biotin carboxylase subunit [Elusimicrobia bacterium]|nr:acetyl-CoA carboxylase biotin carboxylase subunit [Elusimicrobiota bacterium]
MAEFKKVLIANRGEIALRVIRTLREMGIRSVAIYSEADRSSTHVSAADEAVCIGPAPAGQSYLNQAAILSAAKITGADAVHPGYGFLSENAAFSKAVSEAGIVFIGPPPSAIQSLGYKSTARELAIRSGVPVTPGSKGLVSKDFEKAAQAVGYPIMIKAAAGGGGKGMRIARSEGELMHQMHMAQSEAKAGFGDDSVYFERYVERPRHVEIQFAADSHGNVAAFPERDCSMQRRHQKLVEESPSPGVNKALRQRLAASAIKLVKASGYCGVGTVEFLMTQEDEFYFMEVNTRLQVEHPVTELVTGMDLVREQLLIAQGGALSRKGESTLEVNGHCIEHRINAENPDANFAPSPGTVLSWTPPGGPGIRLDSHVYAGYTIPSYYDSLIAKLIVWAPDRNSALARSRRALSEFQVSGINTTIPFHLKILENKDFIAGRADTGTLLRMTEAPQPAQKEAAPCA